MSVVVTPIFVETSTSYLYAIPIRPLHPGSRRAKNGRMMLGMLATLAEYERELIIERVNAGIAAARASGTRFGRPLSDPALITEKLEVAQAARSTGKTAAAAARLVGWSRATLYRHQKHASESMTPITTGDDR
jgi:DNA invertase Pin-like site-specific DNA recombinase